VASDGHDFPWLIGEGVPGEALPEDQMLPGLEDVEQIAASDSGAAP
jgi:hypothetical protein